MKIKYSIIKGGLAFIRAIYAPMKLQKTKNKITIISRQSNEPSMDIALLSDYIVKTYPDVECKIMCSQFETVNKIKYCFHMLAQMRNIASSKVVILDGYCIAASILNHKQDLRIIQMWHALAAIKKFGYQTIGKPQGRSREMAETMCMHRNYDYVLCAGQVTGEHFCEAFHVSNDKLKYLGLPRIDTILSKNEEREALIRRKYGLEQASEFSTGQKRKEIILYVPTFRRNENIQIGDLIRALDPERHILVIKLHPLDKLPVEQIETGLTMINDQEFSSYDWFGICDRIITDYSALGVEATLTGKPLYYYVYDIEPYQANVGLNVDPRREMPQATAINGAELREVLQRPYDYKKLLEFKNRYIGIDTRDCTKQLGDFIYGILKETL